MGPHGIVLVDKPRDITSRKAVDYVMEVLKIKKAGHFGTLDSFATGLLCIGVGQGTKLLPFIKDNPKEYITTIGFDMNTDSDDITGRPLRHYTNVEIDIDKIKQWLKSHRGWITQVPPAFCAQKQQGVPMYKLKRANVEVTPRAKQVLIEDTEIVSFDKDRLKLRIVCSRGTYVRAIARDIGAYLGFGGYLKELKRLKSEGFSVDDACTLDELAYKVEHKEDVVIPLSKALSLSKARVVHEGAIGIREGRPIQISWLIDDVTANEGDRVAILSKDLELLCVARVQRRGGIFGYIERGFSCF
ncbi:MAG: tRNA pseudouridine(55) synthase TruB [Deltaproteobacteria bacterium]|nr:tRNA pseudouridine(55) synthase TruB [Deltaproteobacteria bacterium]